MQRRRILITVSVLSLLVLCGLAWSGQQPGSVRASQPAASNPAPQTIVIHVTSGPDDLFAIMTALQMAEDARALGRKVILMFSKAGARVPMNNTGFELRMGDQPPVRDLLIDLQRRGVDVIVCDFSARTLGILDAEFVNGTFIANTNETLLRRMGSNAAVFTF